MDDIQVTVEQINDVLRRARECIKSGRVEFECINGEERRKNLETSQIFDLTTKSRLDIIKSLTYMDFGYILPETKKSLDEYDDKLYVFFVDKEMKAFNEAHESTVCFFIKLQFVKKDRESLLVVSFHVAEKAATYHFK
ncbi:MAG: hypothetical protein LUD47_04930 [Clostridia bacterium]|nr:hypothetical protein [Clostridia bacterium]